MDWDRDLPTWPHADWSRRIECRPHRWHVQETGLASAEAETLLFLHGAGASTHSWRDVMPVLADRFHLVALDLPGQGFTRMGTRQRCGLDPMAQDIASLCATQKWTPRAIIGHSAGAAIGLRLSQLLTGKGGGPPDVIGINASLAEFDGVAGWLFPVLAKLLAINPLTARIFTLGGGRISQARKLIESTGSHLDEVGLGYYARLIGDRDHVDGALRMMAQWSHGALLRDLPMVTARCLLITAAHDRAVPPETSHIAAARMPDATVMALSELGHLAHEEAPDLYAGIIRDFLTT
jgi:magnesium chelatase accessory protein